ncbi:MAG: hypothetical protein IT452_06345 [Planctomycetia bacterium]|nr:hypothetical protein [Planctomycetia bacterium]
MQRRLQSYVCARVNVKLGADGRPKDEGQRAIWDACKVKGIPSVAVLRSDGTLVASETGPDAEDVEALLAKGMEPKK